MLYGGTVFGLQHPTFTQNLRQEDAHAHTLWGERKTWETPNLVSAWFQGCRDHEVVRSELMCRDWVVESTVSGLNPI